MLPFRVILSHHSRQTHKSCATSALPLPCSLLNCQSKIPAGSGLLISSSNFKPFNLQTFKPLPLPTFPNPRLSVSSPVMRHCLATIMSGSPVTKSPVVHPLSVQLLIKCSSRNSFVLKTIHFDGGVYPRPFFSPSWALPCTFLHSAKKQLCCFQSIAHSFAHFCIQQKTNSVVFNRLRTLWQNTRGWGEGSPFQATLFRLRSHRTPHASSARALWRRASGLLCGRVWLGG